MLYEVLTKLHMLQDFFKEVNIDLIWSPRYQDIKILSWR